MGLLDNIINPLTRPSSQNTADRSAAPGLSALLGTSTPLGTATDIALAIQRNKFANFLNQDAERRNAILQMIPPDRRQELSQMLLSSRPDINRTLADPNAGRVGYNALGLLGSILGGVKSVGTVGRTTGLLREPISELAPATIEAAQTGHGLFNSQFAPQTGKLLRYGDPFAKPKIPTATNVGRRYVKDPTTGHFQGSR